MPASQTSSRRIPTLSSRSAAQRPLFEACEPRQLFALIGPDLMGTGMSLSRDPMPGSGTQVDVNFSIKNDGGLWGDSGAFYVTFWQSDENPTNEYINIVNLGEVRIDSLKSGSTYNGTYTINTQGAGENNTGYILMEIDSHRNQGEWNENNNWRQAEGKDFIGYRAEGNLFRDPQPWKDVFSTPLPVNGTLNAAIGDESIGSKDFDIFDTDLTAGRHYMVDIDKSAGSSLDSFVRVYDRNWNLVASNNNGRDDGESASTDAYVEFTAALSGRYYYVVSNAFNQTGDPRVLTGRTSSADYSAKGAYTISTHVISDKPILYLTTVDANATEGSSDTATFRVTRSGSPDQGLWAYWNLGGTASASEFNVSSTSQTTPTSVFIPAGAQSIDVRVTALDDGVWEQTETATFTLAAAGGYYTGTSPSATINLANANIDRPRVMSQAEIFTDNNGQRITFDFDDDIGPSLDASDFILVNADNGATIDRSKLGVSWSSISRTATVRFSGFAGGMLPNGNYRLTLLAAGVANGGGQSMSGDVGQYCFSLAGDLNRDRKVDFNDLVLLAQSYNTTGRDLAGGNANGDVAGKVDFDDLVVLSQNYGKSLGNPLAAILAPAESIFSETPIDKLAGRTRQEPIM